MNYHIHKGGKIYEIDESYLLCRYLCFLLCLVVIVVKMTFWPVCVRSKACDGWTVAGLTPTILGTAAAFLGILGAILLAAWWAGLDKRVEDRVAEAFKTQIQAVRSTIDQLDVRFQTVDARFKIVQEIIQDSITQLSTQAESATASIQAQGEQLRGQIIGDQVKQMTETQSQPDILQTNVRQKLDDLDGRTEQLRNIMGLTMYELHSYKSQSNQSTPHSQGFRALALCAHVKRDYLPTNAQAGGKKPTPHQQKTFWPVTLIMILIRDACRRAIEEQAPSLSQQVLEATWKDIQTKQVTTFLDLIRQRVQR